jgi:hypothetical protein
MSNKVLPLPKSYLEKILKPVNRLTESCVLKAENDSLFTICSSPDNTVILYAKACLPSKVEENIRLNLISIKKLISGLDCLGENGEFSIHYSNNNIKCESKDHETNEKTYFKYHLVDDSVIRETPVNINKIAQLKFDTEFTIPNSKIKQILSAYVFASELSKIYFQTQEDKVYAEINDKTLQNVDHMRLAVSSSFIGTSIDEPIPISIEVFKNLMTNRSDIKVKINNQYKVFVFNNTEENDVELKYIVSALVK